MACDLPEGHRVATHRHNTVPLMHWPTSVEVTCSAWRYVNTAFGEAVVFCAGLPTMHRVGKHEGRIGIQPVAWSDADLSKAGRIAEGILKWLRDGDFQPGDLAPTYRDIYARLDTSEITVLRAMRILERDGVIKRHGRRWVVL